MPMRNATQRFLYFPHPPLPAAAVYVRSDWNIIKRVFVEADGEFWTAALPPSTAPASNNDQSASEALGRASEGASDSSSDTRRTVSLEETRSAFLRGGFSVVINRLQRRWRGVSELSLALEDVLGQPVNANLYMTPPDCQGFEAHFDWMDGAKLVAKKAGELICCFGVLQEQRGETEVVRYYAAA